MQVIESILYRNKARAGSVSILCKLQILYCTETKPERGLYLFYASYRVYVHVVQTKPERGLYLFYASYRVYIVQKQSQSGVCIYSMQAIECMYI